MTVLVADDEPEILRLLVRIMGKLGISTLTASSGEELLEVWRTNRIDAVLSDVNMTGPLDGIQVCGAIRKADPSARVYLMTGEVYSEVRARECGLEVAFRKPFTIGELTAWARSLRGS